MSLIDTATPQLWTPSQGPVVHAHYKLGKKEAVHNPAEPRLALYTAALAAPPPSCGYTQKIKAWGMMGNDNAGDCAYAGMGHAILQWSTYAQKPFVPSTNQVLAGYEALTGYNPVTGANDTGCVLNDVIAAMVKTGLAGHTIMGSAVVEPGSVLHTQQCVQVFGNAYIGVQLPRSAQGQNVWTVPAGGPRGSGAPGSWGGHAIIIVAYSPSWMWVVSWGELIPMSYGFFQTYCDEVHALLSEDWINNQTQDSYSGLDLAQLRADLPAVA